ncbi:site-specific integrase [Pseudomonas nitroreducens]|uniref:site-specific integrase n=1 Tax=Pseudomonas nitroreducens TaxID=46680 RepID=UPI0028B1B64F|nr:tyrosine-type recombinase/integrase [Pseudomonas nitroreducens]
MKPIELVEEYIHDHDLRDASAKIYKAAMKALERFFGPEVDVTGIERRQILAWRNKVIDGGLSKRSWNTYSNHLRTIWGYAIEHGILPEAMVNPFKKTTVVAPKRPSKIVAGESIHRARRWLMSLVDEELCIGERSRITPAWFWLATFEMFYYTGIRLNALLCLRLQDVDWDNQLILVRGETEKTHREFRVPIVEGLAPHIRRLVLEAERLGFTPKDQLFNVNRFSPHYKRAEMNSDQVEAMYKKLIDKLGVRMTPHRFRHTLATDLMKQPERNIHLTKSLLNHSNIATTMSYIEADYDHMREVLHERSLHQGALQLVRHADETGAPTASKHQVRELSLMEQLRIEQGDQDRRAPMDPATQELASALLQLQFDRAGTEPSLPPEDLFAPSLLFTILSSAAPTPYSRVGSGGGSTRFAARASP